MKIIKASGVISEFGVQWGSNLVTLNNLRSIPELFSHSGTVVGFETFLSFQV
jgi:hypothetical protein